MKRFGIERRNIIVAKHLCTVDIQDDKLDAILKRLDKAREEVYACYSELCDLHTLVVSEEPPAATDGSNGSNH